MESNLDLTLDYRTYRLAAVLSENLPLGELRGISLGWKQDTSSSDGGKPKAHPFSLAQVEQRYLK
ncbi:MAG: hypothetical protein Q6K92_11535 [Thermostichus sp. DG_1_5_bins_95]